jgi:hypothetical protein
MISFSLEVVNLYPENAADTICQALEWIRANAAPGRRRSGSFYARIARSAFEDIRGLAAEGFTYAAICEAFEANGLLPKGSKPYSLSRAIRREGIRRQKRTEPVKAERLVGKTAGKKSDSTAPNPTKAEPVKQDFGAPRTPSMKNEKEDEKIKALTNFAQETALGKLTKHSDGSFDFDWED